MKNDDALVHQYWKNNFVNKDVVEISGNLQLNIARTKGGVEIDDSKWQKTLSYISNILRIDSKSQIAELCCGNGVIIGELTKQCQSGLAIDYSSVLLNQLKQHYTQSNLNVLEADVNEYVFYETFDAIIVYFAIQHFNEKNTFLLIRKCINALNDSGTILLGDIPDEDKKWQYISKPEYKKDYFQRLVESRPKIGYWYKKDFFRAMNDVFENVTIEVIDQPAYQINSDHCFDVVIRK